MQIKMLPPHALRPYTRNARTHSKHQIRQIAASIKRFGFTNPILVSDDYEIVAGHGRFEAAKLLGLACVPVVRLSHLSEHERRAYATGERIRDKIAASKKKGLWMGGFVPLGYRPDQRTL
jgi:ParB-like chromosome segregation protein Spo0J